MKVQSKHAGSGVLFLITAALAFGTAYGVVHTAHLGLIPAILSFAAVCAFQWFIFRSGRSSSYASAQAWAQAQVDIAIEVSNIARSEANAMSSAYSAAIASASATAQVQTVIQLSDGRVMALTPLQEDHEEVKELQTVEHLGHLSDYSDILESVRKDIHEKVTSSDNSEDSEIHSDL